MDGKGKGSARFCSGRAERERLCLLMEVKGCRGRDGSECIGRIAAEEELKEYAIGCDAVIPGCS